MADVQSFFETYHRGFFRIYNLCSERAYSETAFGSPPAVERHPFDDHNPCPLHMVRPFCESVHAFLEADPRNVVAVHCKAGKGRTGMMISAFLLHSGICRTAGEALDTFGNQRTQNGKGVTIPSQRRYVEYYASMLQQLDRNDDMPSPAMLLKTICIPVSPNFDRSGGCSPYFQVYQFSEEKGRMHKVFSSKKCDSLAIGRAHSGTSIFLDVEDLGITVRGDTKVIFYDRSPGLASEGRSEWGSDPTP
ncbi:unnamed protein product [Prorocentrum cordatum]|uniref:Phosphatidylinositol-3,4,5-trisphosphate 3-phosphatase n=1 Tax=Prorocentrum cordatum TaxID=2364126 RepID=A0ABN9PT02_9DINO|nr:unnamed protein product [Polarella glacialis]